MKDYIELARRSLDVVVNHMVDGVTSETQLARGLFIVQANAAIAQAEQLKRIADALTFQNNELLKTVDDYKFDR